jgi:hypothetical protein
MVERVPSIDSPVVDVEVLHLFARLLEATLVVDIRYDRLRMVMAAQDLMGWRTMWWTINTAYFIMPESTPHERAAALRPQNLDPLFMERVDRMLQVVAAVLNTGFE